MTMRRIGIQQEWVSGEKRQLRSTLANQMVGREHDGYLLQLANVRQQTAGAWANAIYAKKAVSLQQELLEHMNHELAATKASYRGAMASCAREPSLPIFGGRRRGPHARQRPGASLLAQITRSSLQN